MTRNAGALHGFLIVDKPAGFTSHDVVARLRRLTGQRKIGHGGTLDPLATGVLVIALGHATRLLPYVVEGAKQYRAEITLGIRTDTYDAEGSVLSLIDPGQISEKHLESALEHFRGELNQQVPLFSAVHKDGKRLYQLARAGEAVEPPIRSITIHELLLCSWNPPVLTLDVTCSQGTYIRSLAEDIGNTLGCGAYLSNLTRTAVGKFQLADAWTLQELANIDLVTQWEVVALNSDNAMSSLPTVLLDQPHAQKWLYGQSVPIASPVQSPIRVYSEDGWLLGVGQIDFANDRSALKPKRVIHPPVTSSDTRDWQHTL